MTKNGHAYWYLASYPKSGNTWCRVFITELMRLSVQEEYKELDLNRDVETGSIASSRLWLNDQLGINTCDLSFAELDPLRGRAGETTRLFAEGERFHKVHDAFRSPDSKGRPVVSTAGCKGAVYILRHPEDVLVSLSHFFSMELGQCVDFLLDPLSGLARQEHSGGKQVRQHLGCWNQHVLSWTDQHQIPVLVIRYEDMLVKGPETFMALTKFLDLPHESDLVNKALENTSIDRLKKLEDQVDGFSEKPDGCERFFRSGRTGEGAEKLDLDHRRRLFSKFKQVMKRFNYEGPPDE